MGQLNRVRGLDAVIKNMRQHDRKLQGGLDRGLVKAGLFLQAKSVKEVPVEFGPLKASAFTRKTGKGLNAKVTVGYTAAYAIYVHENLDAAHGRAFNAKYAEEIQAGQKKSRGPNQKAKFLEDPYKDRGNQKFMKALIVGEMRK